MDRNIFLKVKIKSLAAEAKIIRLEERKARDPLMKSYLAGHRRQDVRNEARHSQIAYAFLRGKPYASTELVGSVAIDWTKIRAMVERFRPIDAPAPIAALQEWIKAAEAYRVPVAETVLA